LLTQAIDRKRCASCACWQGPRHADFVSDSVLIEAETVTGNCLGGGWDGSERRARSACGHWKIWPVLIQVA
jgi:hypothetical protein